MKINEFRLLKFVPKGPIINIPALVQVMVCRLVGAKQLSEPMMVRLPTHISVTRPQWVNEIIEQGVAEIVLTKACPPNTCF